MITKTVWFSLNDINELQTDVMKIIHEWGHHNKTPIPLKMVVAGMKKQGVMPDTTVKAIGVLLNKGFIRRANTISNQTFFVQLRTI